jgi:putative DNA primase/helicase
MNPSRSRRCPKAFALIGHLPPTLRDRSISIPLRRKPKGRGTQPIEEHELTLKAAAVRSDLLRWAQDKRHAPLDRRPAVPDLLHDRAADNWRPLLAIADDAGGDWPQRARAAAVLLTPSEEDEQDVPTMLLRDIRDAFISSGKSVLFSERVVSDLCARENRPWAEYDRGRPLTPIKLAQALKEFGIEPKRIRYDGCNLHGYRVEWFAELFATYFTEPEPTEQPEQV